MLSSAGVERNAIIGDDAGAGWGCDAAREGPSADGVMALAA
jgi:hypothetical protein